jgi:hypothetical protein
MTYDTSKVKNELSFSFRSIEETIDNTIRGKIEKKN